MELISDLNGFDHNGNNKDGFDQDGIHKDCFDSQRIDRAGLNEQGINRNNQLIDDEEKNKHFFKINQ